MPYALEHLMFLRKAIPLFNLPLAFSPKTLTADECRFITSSAVKIFLKIQENKQQALKYLGEPGRSLPVL
jgi:hypothetical protein